MSETLGESELQRIQKKSKKMSRTVPSSKLQSSDAIKTNYLPALRNASGKRASRHKRHFSTLDPNTFLTLFNQQHVAIDHEFAEPTPLLSHISNGFSDIDPSFLHKIQTKDNYNTDIINHVFYLSQQHVVHTTFKVYNAVLYYQQFVVNGYKINALELELDTPEYNLMIMLPDFNTDLVTASSSLKYALPLRVLRKQLKPKWVQAIIPDFKLNGTMFLTNDLQNVSNNYNNRILTAILFV